MKLYALSIVITTIIDTLAEKNVQKHVFSDIKNISYAHIGKYKIKKKEILKELLIWTLYLCPFGVNILFALIVASKSSNKSFIDEYILSTNSYENDPDLLMDIYEKQKELDKSIEDSFKLEGLEEKEIKEQMNLAYEESKYKKITDEMYEDIKASHQALTFMKEIEFYENLDLTPQERIKLLKEYKKAFLNESKENQKPIEKTLKLIDRNNNSKLNYSKK